MSGATSRYLEIRPNNIPSDGKISFKNGMPMLSFTIASQNGLLDPSTIRIVGNLRVFRDNLDPPTPQTNADNPKITMDNRLGVFALWEQLTIRHSKSKMVCEQIRHYNRYMSSYLGTSSSTQDLKRASHRSGYTGINDGLTSSQYVVDGRLVPSRPVLTTKIATKNSIDAFHCFELEKSLSNAGIDPLSFVEFADNFCMGRAFGLQNGAMDMRGKDLAVQLKYESPVTAPEKPKMFKTFVYHIRRLVIRNGAVSVEQ